MANVNSNGFTLFFAVVACVISGTLLSLASLGLKDIQQVNVKVDKQKSVLQAAGLFDPKASNAEVGAWFEGDNPKIKTYAINFLSGEKSEDMSLQDLLKLPDGNFTKKEKNEETGVEEIVKGYQVVYECSVEGKESLILPIVGKGLWGKMHGYLALAKDGNQVLGIKFYDHKETPGLGAEINNPDWEGQFKDGKKILSDSEGSWSDRFVGLDVLKGLKVKDLPEAKQTYAVDGLSGATITANGVKAILQEQIKTLYGPFLQQRKS